ncbi:hypothetical protein ACFLTA_02470 [Bacteroidota bacterium]
MARSGLRPMFNTRDLGRLYDKFENRTNKVLLEALQFAGEYFIREARLHGKYTDITGNLRSSIGYAIVDNGEIIKMNIKEAKKGTDKQSGVNEGGKLLLQLANEHNTGLVLIGCAGMDYAVHVENISGKDVISGSYIATRHMLRTSLKKAMLK